MLCMEVPYRKDRWDPGFVRLSQMMSKVDFPYMNSNIGSKIGPYIESRLTAKPHQTEILKYFLETISREEFGWWESPWSSKAMLFIFFLLLQLLYICLEH